VLWAGGLDADSAFYNTSEARHALLMCCCNGHQHLRLILNAQQCCGGTPQAQGQRPQTCVGRQQLCS
jgi:hypothetical protein